MSMTLLEIERALKQLRLSGVRATLQTRIVQAQSANQAFLETFSLILQDELDRRRSRLIERRYQQSGLDERVTLAEFDWSFNPSIHRKEIYDLATCQFIHQGIVTQGIILVFLLHNFLELDADDVPRHLVAAGGAREPAGDPAGHPAEQVSVVMVLAAQEFFVVVQLPRNAHFVASRAKLRAPHEGFQEGLLVKLRLGLHQLLVDVLQQPVGAVGKRVMDRLVDRVVGVSFRAVDVCDGVARGARDPGQLDVRHQWHESRERHH